MWLWKPDEGGQGIWRRLRLAHLFIHRLPLSLSAASPRLAPSSNSPESAVQAVHTRHCTHFRAAACEAAHVEQHQCTADDKQRIQRTSWCVYGTFLASVEHPLTRPSSKLPVIPAREGEIGERATTDNPAYRTSASLAEETSPKAVFEIAFTATLGGARTARRVSLSNLGGSEVVQARLLA
jgi:hypothetical protein